MNTTVKFLVATISILLSYLLIISTAAYLTENIIVYTFWVLFAVLMPQSVILRLIYPEKFWVKGRIQNSKYYKDCVYKFKIFRLAFDCYILKYEEQTELPLHVDTVNGKHYRMNILLKGETSFYCLKTIFRNSNIVIFRPDKYQHALFASTKSYKLSFGFAIMNKKEKIKLLTT